MRLKTLLQRIALQQKKDFPFPDDLESYVEDFIPNILLKSESLQQAFGIENDDMEKLYEEGYAYYENSRYSDALIVFRWLVLFNSYEAKYWMGYAANQQLLKQYEKALHAYAVAALLDCENPYPHFYAYTCYVVLENMEDAGKALELAYQRCIGKDTHNALKYTIETLREEVTDVLWHTNSAICDHNGRDCRNK